jgi:hypothetical protein
MDIQIGVLLELKRSACTLSFAQHVGTTANAGPNTLRKNCETNLALLSWTLPARTKVLETVRRATDVNMATISNTRQVDPHEEVALMMKMPLRRR